MKLVALLDGRKLLNQLTLGSRNIDSWLEQKHDGKRPNVQKIWPE